MDKVDSDKLNRILAKYNLNDEDTLNGEQIKMLIGMVLKDYLEENPNG